MSYTYTQIQTQAQTHIKATSRLEVYQDQVSPPTVPISRETRNSPTVYDAYNKALDEHGPVVVVPRHGRAEYVVDHRYAHEILTNSKDYTFDKAVFEILHLDFMSWFKEGNFVQDLDSMIQHGVQPRMKGIVDQIVPVFHAYMDKMEDELRANDKPTVELDDVFGRVQEAIAHGMVVLILGPAYSSPAMARHLAAITVAMANLTGMHENTHGWEWFPFLWCLMTTMAAIFFTIVPRFFVSIVPSMWKARKQHLANGLAARHSDYVPLFDYLLAKNYHGQTGVAAFGSFVWCAILALGIIFASIHQTAVTAFWVIVKLAQQQDEYLEPIRREWESTVSTDERGIASLSVRTLPQLTLLDSFIRETMRTKGDVWGPIRHTTAPVRVGPYLLPKDALCMVLVARAHQHPDNFGSTGSTFDGFQWAKKQRPAVQGGKDFLSFGLGRWACPGRHLAIHEIKILTYLFFTRFDIQLKNDTYKITNWINTTSVPPEATLILRQRHTKA